MADKSQPPAVSIFHPQNQADTRTGPEIPTMTSQSLLEPLIRRPVGAPPEELAEDIEAKPLSMPEFAVDIQPYLMNQGLAARWIFTDRRRYAQAKAQGFRNCTKQDLKPSFGTLSPFAEENGTKYINGDLILMLIDRKRYLGALKFKHNVAMRLSDAAVTRKVSADKARQEMGSLVNAVNQQRQVHGQPPVMTVFDPNQSDLEQTGLPATELGRLGQHRGKVDTGKMADLKGKEEK